MVQPREEGTMKLVLLLLRFMTLGGIRITKNVNETTIDQNIFIFL